MIGGERLTRRVFLKLLSALGGDAFLVACGKPWMETPTSTPTPIPEMPDLGKKEFSRELLPGQFVTEQKLLTHDSILEKSSVFRDFFDGFKENRQGAEVMAWGAEATVSSGRGAEEKRFALFCHVSEEGKIAEYIVRPGHEGGEEITSLSAIKLERAIVTAEDGKDTYTLSQLQEVGEGEDLVDLEKPLPILWIGSPKEEYDQMSLEDRASVPVYFNVIGGIEGASSRNKAGVFDKELADSYREMLVPPETGFVPEGFQIGELGLLRNPQTGVDVITLNKDADWKRLREEILIGLWEANIVWSRFTGPETDATNYTREKFMEAALQGQEFHIGIPVRVDTGEVPNGFDKKHASRAIVLKMVDVRLDNIGIQVLDPYAFREYTGGDWTTEGQEAYACKGDAVKGNTICLFSVENNNLIISVLATRQFGVIGN